MKTVLILMLTGALLGVVAASFIVPPALSWYSAPGGLPQGTQIQAVVEIPQVIRYATSTVAEPSQGRAKPVKRTCRPSTSSPSPTNIVQAAEMVVTRRSSDRKVCQAGIGKGEALGRRRNGDRDVTEIK